MVHVLRMDNTRHAKIAISWTPYGKKKERQSKKKTLSRTIKRERQDFGFQSWTYATRVSKERDKWR